MLLVLLCLDCKATYMERWSAHPYNRRQIDTVNKRILIIVCVGVSTAVYCNALAGVYNVEGVSLWGQWDRSLKRCLLLRCIHHYGYSGILHTALWYEQCITLPLAKELTLDSDCLQCLPLDGRHALLDAIALADMDGTCSFLIP
jgi:hypothetical protein